MPPAKSCGSRTDLHKDFQVSVRVLQLRFSRSVKGIETGLSVLKIPSQARNRHLLNIHIQSCLSELFSNDSPEDITPTNGHACYSTHHARGPSCQINSDAH